MLLQDVRPRFPVNGVMRHAQGYAGFVCQLLLCGLACCVPVTHDTNRRLREFAVGMVFTVGHLLFVAGVFHVVGVRAEKEMGRVTAERIVPAGTVVADLHVVRNRATKQLPCDTVGENHRFLAVWCDGGQQATSAFWAAGPEPAAAFRLVHLLPKAVGKWTRARATLFTRHAAETGAALADNAGVSKKSLSTGFANAGDFWSILAGHRETSFLGVRERAVYSSAAPIILPSPTTNKEGIL